MTWRPTCHVFNVYTGCASEGDLTEYKEIRHTFPVGWIDSCVFDLDEEFVIAYFWDWLLLHNNSVGLGSSSVSAPMTRSEKHSHLLDHYGFHRSGQLNLGNHGRRLV